MDEIKQLNNEISALKEKFSDTSDLARSINSLVKIFAEASSDLKIDTHDAVLVGQKLDKIINRLEKIEIQNEKIAKGIVAVADMVSERNKPPTKEFSRPIPQPDTNIPQPLPSYNVPKQDDDKKSFMNFKM